MKLFKNFKTRRQLKEENKKLKERIDLMIKRPPEIKLVERQAKKVMASCTVPFQYRDYPEEYIKEQIARGIVNELQPIIEYDFSDDENGSKIYYGFIYIMQK